ncbi:PQQ-binding-like beta-propeller repeat protein [Streptomyces sp. NPDC126510]|uniref:outer membrane protein assembly factor BamB family protein n=1 Tax=Streptomyces sp. NPDC126510 TaxID=3155317 RepID=UPI003322C258
MTTEHVEEKVRQALRAVALDRVRAPGDLVEKVVRRRSRRRFSQAAGTAVAVAAISVGAVFGFADGGTARHDRPVRPAASPATPPEGWKPWQTSGLDVGERGCVVEGAALYCSGSAYDAAKIDANTGKRLWGVEVNREGDGIDHPLAGRDGVVYAYRNHTAENRPDGDYSGGTDLMAVNAGTGKVLWTVEMPQDDRTDQAAMLIDGAVLANTPSIRTMSALDPLTGKEKWRHTWDKGIVCQRAVLSGVPYLLCTPDIEKPDATDVLRLDPTTGTITKVATLPGGQQLVGTSGDRIVLIAAGDGGRKDLQLTTVNSSGEHVSHPYRIDGVVVTSAVVGDRLITVSRQGKASARSLTTGKNLWTRPVGIKVPSPDTIPGLAKPVASAKQGVVYFLNPAGDLSGLDLHTGEQVWRTHLDTGKTRPGFGGSPQLLLYQDVLVARNGSEMVSLLPRIGD